MRGGGALFGPPSLIENHDEAYYLWRDAGCTRKRLVHIDAHDDMRWADDTQAIDIGNYVCAALKEGIVREVFWVVPDPSWSAAPVRRRLLRQLKRLGRNFPGRRNPLVREGGLVTTLLLGKPVTVCALESLPVDDEDVLLDIDVDYMILPDPSRPAIQAHGQPPWCWPADLARRLVERGISAERVTIAYSVQGGFTPQRWKYLGDELALRLREPEAGSSELQGFERMREAFEQPDPLAAEERYREACSLLPRSAAPWLCLAWLQADAGRSAEARQSYGRVLELDPSYRNPFNTPALALYQAGRHARAEREHRRMLIRDPEDPFAHFGLGRLAARSKRWTEAERFLSRSLELGGPKVDAHRVLARVFERQDRRRDAVDAYERSLELARAGHVSLKALTATNPERNAADPQHWLVHARLARLYERDGKLEWAVSHYRVCLAGVRAGFGAGMRLTWLYLRSGRWRDFGREARRTVMRFPASLPAAFRGAVRTLVVRFPWLRRLNGFVNLRP